MFKYPLEQLTSEIIKYENNCWFGFQISYWDEFKTLYDKLKINQQMLLNNAMFDKKISKYESAMIEVPSIRFCFQREVKASIISCKDWKINPIFLKAIEKTNDVTEPE
jgi:UDP-glucose 6-dehydrogenase